MKDTDSYNHRFILISLKEKGLMETGAEASFQFLNMTGFLIPRESIHEKTLQGGGRAEGQPACSRLYKVRGWGAAPGVPRGELGTDGMLGGS